MGKKDNGRTRQAPAGRRLSGLLITIDGPAGAGKTTVSRQLARQLGYRYVDTGALYRAVALVASEHGIAPGDDQGLQALCRQLDLAFVSRGGTWCLYANGANVTDRIRTPEIAMVASAVSARPVVRRFLLDVQRNIGSQKDAVFEGRDMGTVVFPQADVKFFLTASIEARALRRFKEYAGSTKQSLETVKADMRRRDENDSRRKLAPLRAADDAVTIDCTQRSADQVVEEMTGHIERLFDG